MCLVILILPLAQLMKNLKAKTFPAILRSFVRPGKGVGLRMTRMAPFYCGKTQRTEIECPRFGYAPLFVP